MGHYTTKPQQHLDELADFVKFLANKKIRSFLEVGSKFGGVLWAVSRIMPKGSRIVSIDLPNDRWGRSDSETSLIACIAELKRKGFDAHWIRDDCTKPDVVERVRKLSPFDAVFIDANHTEPYVRKDFANYGSLTPIVCFHDIGQTRPIDPDRKPIEVPKVWAELKQTYKDRAVFTEIIHDDGINGIGIMEWTNERHHLEMGRQIQA